MADHRPREERLAARARGYDKAWSTLRDKHLTAHRNCVVCGEPAVIVDHIVTVKQNPRRRLDPSNLQSLCRRHHNILTKAYDEGRHTGACDEDGRPLDPDHPWHSTNGRGTPRSKAEDPLLAARMKQAAIRRTLGR